MRESLRLTEILTTASAIANFLGDAVVGPGQMLDAIAVLEGQKRLDDFGRPVSPLVPRGRTGADPAVMEVAQRWFATLGHDVNAALSAGQLDALRAELVALGRAAAPADESTGC